jgi:hypothetical protein
MRRAQSSFREEAVEKVVAAANAPVFGLNDINLVMERWEEKSLTFANKAGLLET